MCETCEDGECLKIRSEIRLLGQLVSGSTGLDDARAYWEAKIAALETELRERCCRCDRVALW